MISNGLTNEFDKQKDDEVEVQKLMLLMSAECNLFKMQCIGYISGFVVKMLGKLVNCDVCIKTCLDELKTKGIQIAE